MDGLRALWRGQVPLARTYWLYGVGVLSGINLVLGPLVASGAARPESLGQALLLLAAALASLAYAFFISIAIWRSASKYRGLSFGPAWPRQRSPAASRAASWSRRTSSA